jgi:hypothetical protein
MYNVISTAINSLTPVSLYNTQGNTQPRRTAKWSTITYYSLHVEAYFAAKPAVHTAVNSFRANVELSSTALLALRGPMSS